MNEYFKLAFIFVKWLAVFSALLFLTITGHHTFTIIFLALFSCLIFLKEDLDKYKDELQNQLNQYKKLQNIYEKYKIKSKF